MQAKNVASEENFSGRLSQAMDASGISQARLAERTGLTAPYISELRKGRKQNPSPEVAGKLAAALGCSPVWLMHGQGDPPAPGAAGAIADEHPGTYGRAHDPPQRPIAGHGLDSLPREALTNLLQRGIARLAKTTDPAEILSASSHIRDLASALESQTLETIAAGWPEAKI